jgi:hypothetical protein
VDHRLDFPPVPSATGRRPPCFDSCLFTPLTTTSHPSLGAPPGPVYLAARPAAHRRLVVTSKTCLRIVCHRPAPSPSFSPHASVFPARIPAKFRDRPPPYLGRGRRPRTSSYPINCMQSRIVALWSDCTVAAACPFPQSFSSANDDETPLIDSCAIPPAFLHGRPTAKLRR